MTKNEFITERTRIISRMLDNPDKYGIYPTTICFNELDALYDKITTVQSPSKESSEQERMADSIKNAILFIIENSDREDFIMRNCRITSVDGDDNSIELSGYWREQREIVDQHLIKLSQFASQSNKVTDEEIEKFANEHTVTNSLNDDELIQEMFRKGIIRGAKWYRDQLK